MNLNTKASFKFSPPENPYDNRTLQGGTEPPRFSHEGVESFPVNLLNATPRNDGSKSTANNQINLNIKRAESSADNNSEKYHYYDKWNSNAVTTPGASTEESFPSNQPKVYRPSRDEVKHIPPQAAERTNININRNSGEILAPARVAPVRPAVQVARGEQQNAPSRPKSLAVSPFPEDGYSPFERLPSKPLHMVQQAKDGLRNEGKRMKSPSEQRGVPVGQKVNSSINKKQGKYQAKLGQVPPLPVRNAPKDKPTATDSQPPFTDGDGPTRAKEFDDSEPSDSPPPQPKVQYAHIDPRKVYNLSEVDSDYYLQPMTLSEMDRSKKRSIKTWEYSSDSSSSKGMYPSDSDDSSDLDCVKPIGSGHRSKEANGGHQTPVRKAPPLPKRKEERMREDEERRKSAEVQKREKRRHFQQRDGGGGQQVKGRQIGENRNTRQTPARVQSEFILRTRPADQQPAQKEAGRRISDWQAVRKQKAAPPLYGGSLPRPAGHKGKEHKRDASLDFSFSQDFFEEDVS